MIKQIFPYQLYLVISENSCKKHDFLKVAEEAILGGVDIIQLREKEADTPLFTSRALKLKEVTDKYNVPLIINDNIEVAKKVNAHGIHVGNNDIPPSLIREEWKACKSLGYSIEYIEQLENKEVAFADCLGISPVFKTTTKQDTLTEWGIEGIEAIRKLTDKPLIAIGNINKDNAGAVIKAGADCVAVVSAICSADNPQKAAYELKNTILKSL